MVQKFDTEYSPTCAEGEFKVGQNGVQEAKTHGEEVGAAFGLLPHGRRRVGSLRHVDAQLLLAGAGCGRHRRRVVAQAAAAVTRLGGTEVGRCAYQLSIPCFCHVSTSG